MTNKLEQLKKVTVVVADTGDINSIKKFQPQDATTNPSLILAASKLPEYQHLIAEAADYANKQDPARWDANALDYLSVAIGYEISKIVPGYVSTEVDCRESYNLRNTVERARKLITLYEERGLSRDRVLIKIASTWAGIKAAEILEKEGIHCNLTLLFSFAQARACAEANVTLISPFVGRILDFYKEKNPQADYAGDKDPGVISVSTIYDWYKKYGYNTIIMGASFRNTGEIESLAGCDRLTIGPGLLEQLEADQGQLEVKLTNQYEGKTEERLPALTEDQFYWEHNKDQMAIVKLAEGIVKFAADTETLLNVLRAAK
ncbi:transaldolase [Psittacicella melopsittaci]|uniref:Transaldolase n=1 Tax=Psittacicella melopsittaci TaxID=2028576 RepID=A0A3A1YC67_9GAMM|nr:transaldolase [Psittacicella melopsittaci]RIY33707.1 transaldolase [Psittacicella melopsittaci]